MNSLFVVLHLSLFVYFRYTCLTIWRTESDSDRLFFFFNMCCGTLGTAATTGLLYQPRMRGESGNWWNKDRQGEPKYSKKICPSATLSTTNPTCLDPVLNPGRLLCVTKNVDFPFSQASCRYFYYLSIPLAS
jgi:hypothetical protein